MRLCHVIVAESIIIIILFIYLFIYLLFIPSHHHHRLYDLRTLHGVER